MHALRCLTRGGVTGRGVGCPTLLLRSSFQPNLTSLTNQVNRNDDFVKFGHKNVPVGVPRLDRRDVRAISVLHETPHLLVAGRNFANGFSGNQFLLIQKERKECIFVDAADDWPDDWVSFIASSGLRPTHFFLTHCHVDSIVNLNAFLAVMEQHFQVRLGIMWCPGEQPWVDAFPRSCERYGRVEEMRQPLPLLKNSLYSHYTYAHQLRQRQRTLDDAAASHLDGEEGDEAGSGKGEGGATRNTQRRSSELPRQLVRTHDILLSSATNRSTSFYEFGPHSVLHYIFTPGHSPGHMMLSLPRERLLFTGDALYYGGVGRVDLPWGCGGRLAESLLTLEDFPDSTVLLPGHGRLTTLGRERRENPALRALYERRAAGDQQVSVGFNTGYL
ncbi:putative mitochondrial metallo-beta-lactamase family protein-like protein [Leptomonas pyrrhocoris]|uniref:Putative mitochondrial metallo-beta-lactamase family protein-like protein n=1 Tax=Leptomonas pyrrhocoris TaxID=157538 RepID=A0A0M9G7B8_LEPPY|nr:putative mitochondrial metallo-beta-lactamase family protein-like protein [Leptomonas pyrrhocoris]KPA84027.1 putative mitochondrial metallo-beta-lactamase family protein-like protein [Leptomonas pyrrhocoris]|eukprot:XP_015662466.1 putative mitochondrial metallo-beta-lactamase family protein-like protein [Leptomonas pyrrhocoris]